MAQSTRFWDRIAERYSKQPIADEATYRKKLQVSREYFCPDMAVLGLSILHLLENRDDATAKVYKLLKPGGVFISGTICIGVTMMRFLRPILPVGKFFGLMLSVFTAKELAASLTDAGFEIDRRWQPGKGNAVFIVARKPD